MQNAQPLDRQLLSSNLFINSMTLVISILQVTQCDFVLYFECSEDVMEKRLMKRAETSGRSDDNVETIRKRFKTFTEKTLPVIEHYKSINKLKKVHLQLLACFFHDCV